MTADRIVLANMRFQARHGVHDWERAQEQPFEVDVELVRDLSRAGASDALADTIDYGRVHAVTSEVMESTSFYLLEAIAETIAGKVLAAFEVDAVVVRVRKPAVKLGGPLDYAGVEIRRDRRAPSS